MNFTKYRQLILLLIITLASTLFIWFGFYLNLPQKLGFPATTLETVFANYDGPNYMVIAKCGYNKTCIGQNFSLPQPLEYYPAHLPGYPLIIKYFSYYTTTPKAMLLATLFGSLFLTGTTYYFFKLFAAPPAVFWLTLVSIFFPARMFVLRLVGAPESWFIGSILISIIYYKKGKYLPSAIFAALAQLLKSPGILLFTVYGILFLQDLFKNKKINLNYFWYILTPLTVFLIFNSYKIQTGDFWAYFHSGDNFHLTALPYEVFVSNRSWINTMWLEDVIYILIISFIGLKKLIKKYNFTLPALFPLIFTVATVFVAHRDIGRYIAPIYPFIFLAYSKTIKHQSSRKVFYLLLPAVILFAINFIIGNTAPIADWTPYL
ncbi:hypothetical protein KBC75_05330 [Candidatus Shapirobacteria bacterium]|nr:hypothetical protein [Candidatus Shapirobacteria bacterium]